MNISDDSCYYSPCKACGKKLNTINDFTAHVLDEHPIRENYTYNYEDSQHRKIGVFRSFYGTFCWNYVRPDVTKYRDEHDDLCDKTTEQTKEELMETIKSNGWKYVESEEISSDYL